MLTSWLCGYPLRDNSIFRLAQLSRSHHAEHGNLHVFFSFKHPGRVPNNVQLSWTVAWYSQVILLQRIVRWRVVAYGARQAIHCCKRLSGCSFGTACLAGEAGCGSPRLPEDFPVEVSVPSLCSSHTP